MTNDIFKCFEMLNAAAMQSKYIANDGTFVFENRILANIVKADAKKNNIKFDEASSETEFKIENDKIVIYPSYERILSSFPTNINYDKCYCYYSKEECRLVILGFDKNNIPKSFYFSDKDNIESNREYSFSNVFYWQKIYELLYENISDGPNSDKSIIINTFEKGKCKFSYSSYNPVLNDRDLRDIYNHFKEIIELTALYPMLLRNRCVERLSKTNESTLENLIFELDEICNKVSTDFTIFVEKIDFDSYIQKYNEKTESFISQARNIIEKMLSNIFSLPLTYAGAIFTFDKLSDNTFSLFLFIALSIYTLFSCGFLIYEIIDTFSIKKHFEKELKAYTNDSPNLLKKVESDKKSINRRLLWIRIICFVLIVIFLSLLIYFGFKIFTNININTTEPSLSIDPHDE